MTVKIKVIMGSTRQGRFSDKPAQWIFEKLQKMKQNHFLKYNTIQYDLGLSVKEEMEMKIIFILT